MSDARAAGAELAPLVLRLVLGVAFLLHGAQKLDLLEPDRAYPKTSIDSVSWTATKERVHREADRLALAGRVPESYKRPAVWAAASAELAGGLLVLLGAFTRLGALSIAAVTGFGIWTYHAGNGFFVENSGFEYPALILAACAALLLAGPGKIALDGTLLKKKKDGPPKK